MSTIHDPSQTMDFGSLTRLKAQAAKDPSGQARTVAGQFEALFIQQMIKSMRAASPGDPLTDGAGVRMFRDMQDQQLAASMAKSGGIGLSEVILRQLTPQGGKSTKVLPPRPDGFPSLDLKKLRAQANVEGDSSKPVGEATTESGAVGAKSPQAAAKSVESAARALPMPAALAFRTVSRVREASGGASHETEADHQRIRWQEPASFVRDLMPHARAAAARLGVDPQVLIAQSALETGWGRHLPEDASGRPNMNLFGIKAQGGWNGDKTVASTLEFEQGAMVRKSEAFRAYGSIRAAFDDYVDFLQSNPRYTEALKHAGDSERFVQELQKAGYATDPRYADKIISILRDGPLASRA
ncbi:MAG: flagellar assembly peptidoglycan hydrolase FlgJ [Pseudomonadota bacterium]